MSERTKPAAPQPMAAVVGVPPRLIAASSDEGRLRRIGGELGAVRTSSKCIKCGSLAIGHLSRRFDDRGDRGGSLNSALLGIDTTTRQGAGVLEAFVCTECGYLETYVKDPATVPFDELQGFRWVNEPNARRGPFR